MFYRHFEFIFVLLLILKNETMDDKTLLSYIMENFQLQYITEKFSIAYENSEGDIEIKKKNFPNIFSAGRRYRSTKSGVDELERTVFSLFGEL